MRVPIYLVVPAAGFVVAVAATVALLLALPGPARRGVGLGDAEQVEVAAVVSAEGHDTDLVVLRAVKGQALVPVPVTETEGARIREGDPKGDRSLLEEAVGALGGSIEAALLDGDGRDLSAELLVEAHGHRFQLPATAAEAIAAAVETGKPIYTTRRALEASALSGDDLRKLHSGIADGGDGAGPSVSM